ncbi:uncharacterized protein L3040_004427 [Drepanopeziza brunnea f. sp. 'multigermtubi']|uniref:Low temperature viability protein n=1 Tax=Marssonina brunnea f. sp. multigermtubi (strain MB_m1) TaxID=1072389 RepID=K1WZ35_MARBU|nr:low temperature viability protein [Drepanopeziza brunnea f. sp. 'multigermtubi' MB_m1]EKD17887.1 low temperature viability protein [Drepanopeziza brunnea f. sp. 'multigermtubi' MB_m1]KAJ5043039.1 hypothetical protein L3040_004427 [Drepanopeziza brunnea f. sp. 'multigermtubi']
MPRKQWIDKKTATHFTVLHRPQNDPLIHDASASSMILNPTVALNSTKSKKIDDLASELGSELNNIRDNEGEAATHGIYYDDTEYDYMQHMRDVGSGSGDAHFVEAQTAQNKGKAKQQSLEDALKNASLEDRARMLLDDEILPSKNLRKVTYQAQQDVPDVLAGFQPDMDPRLREVLVALEDDAYVDDEDDIFGELAKDGEEIDEEEFEHGAWDHEEDGGWESDDTAKPTKDYREAPKPTPEVVNDEREDHGDGNWLANFIKRDQQKSSPRAAPSDAQSSMMTTTTNGGRRKKRKGALTNPSNYSMSSSSMFRTEGLTDLDKRFEKIEERYNEDMDDMASVSMSSTASSVTGPVRGDFDSIMDDFLGNHSMSGKKFVKKGKYQSGMEQLDEVRKGLGPAIIRKQRA